MAEFDTYLGLIDFVENTPSQLDPAQNQRPTLRDRVIAARKAEREQHGQNGKEHVVFAEPVDPRTQSELHGQQEGENSLPYDEYKAQLADKLQELLSSFEYNLFQLIEIGKTNTEIVSLINSDMGKIKTQIHDLRKKVLDTHLVSDGLKPVKSYGIPGLIYASTEKRMPAVQVLRRWYTQDRYVNYYMSHRQGKIPPALEQRGLVQLSKHITAKESWTIYRSSRFKPYLIKINGVYHIYKEDLPKIRELMKSMDPKLKRLADVAASPQEHARLRGAIDRGRIPSERRGKDHYILEEDINNYYATKKRRKDIQRGD